MSSRRAVSQLARAAAAARGRSLQRRCIASSSTACLASTSTSSASSSSSAAPEGSPAFGTCLAVATCGNGDHGRLGHGGGCSSLSRFTLVTRGGLGGGLSSSAAAASSRFHSTRPVAVAAGGAHTLVLTADGAVLSFGLNDAGQLGHSEGAGFVTVPMEALIPEEAVAIAAGDRHSLAVGASGRVWAWGAGGGAGASPGDDGGGAGAGALPPARLPRLVPGVGSAAAVAAGGAHSLILCREDGDRSSRGVLYSWGDGSRGALGHAEGAASATGSGFFSFFSSSSRRKNRGRAAAERAAPRLLRSLAGYDVRAIAASGSRSGAIVVAKEEGGSGSGSGIGSGGGGRVLVWGDDGGFRAAVSGAGRAALDRPTPVPGFDSFSASLLALGRSHALVAREGGTPLLAWGDGGDHGALGLSPSSSSSSSSSFSSNSPPPPPTASDAPCRVAALDGKIIRSVSAGWKHSLACCEVPAEAVFGGNPSSSSSSSPPPASLFAWGWGGSQGSEGPLDPTGTSTGGGQLGTGDDLDRPRPFAVSELVLLSPEGDESGGGEGGGEEKRRARSPPRSRLLTRWRALQVSAGLNHSAALVEVALDE